MKSAILNILGSNVLSQLIIVASTPLLTRIYTQSDFGLFGVATTISLLLSTILSMRLEHSIHVTELAASRLFSACLGITAMVSFMLLLIVGLLHLGSVVENRHNLWLILVFSISLAVSASSIMHLNYQHRFRTIAILNLLVPTIFITGALNITTPWPAANPLLFWQTIAYASTALLAVLVQHKTLVKLNIAAIWEALKIEKGNWQYLVPSSLLSVLSLNLSVIGATALFDTGIAGLIVIAQRIARAPVSVIGNGLNEVLRSSIPARKHIMRTFKVIALLSTTMALLMVLAVYFTPERAYSFILGDGWTGIKSVLIITTVGASLQLIGTSVISLLTSFKKRTDLQINLALFICGMFALGTTFLFELTAINYLWLHTVLVAGVYLSSFGIAYYIAKDVTS